MCRSLCASKAPTLISAKKFSPTPACRSSRRTTCPTRHRKPSPRRSKGDPLMAILINKDTKVITQGITGKTGQFRTRMCRDYANGKNCFVAGVHPTKAGTDFEGIPIYGSVKEAKEKTGATVSVIYVPPAGAAAAIDEAVEAGLDLVVCITEGIPVRDMVRTRAKMKGKTT